MLALVRRVRTLSLVTDIARHVPRESLRDGSGHGCCDCVRRGTLHRVWCLCLMREGAVALCVSPIVVTRRGSFGTAFSIQLRGLIIRERAPPPYINYKQL